MIELLKSPEDVLQPDVRSSLISIFDSAGGFFRPATMQDQHDCMIQLPLHSGVPDEVQSLMNTVKMLFIYGWFYYPCYAVAHCFTAMCVEMALRKRFPKQTGARDRRGLRELLNEAVKNGLISDDGFATVKYRQADDERFAAYLKEITGEELNRQTKPYVEILADTLPMVRNSFAHPRGHWIITPGMAIEAIRTAVELINQLWPGPSPAIIE